MKYDKVIKLFLNHNGEDYVRFEFDKTKNACDNGLPAPRVHEIIEHEG